MTWNRTSTLGVLLNLKDIPGSVPQNREQGLTRITLSR